MEIKYAIKSGLDDYLILKQARNEIIRPIEIYFDDIFDPTHSAPKIDFRYNKERNIVIPFIQKEGRYVPAPDSKGLNNDEIIAIERLCIELEDRLERSGFSKENWI
jgi:hypothetical protein